VRPHRFCSSCEPGRRRRRRRVFYSSEVRCCRGRLPASLSTGPSPKIVVYWTNSRFPALPDMVRAGIDDFIAEPNPESLRRLLVGTLGVRACVRYLM
jgi:hypothetical protein